MTDDDSTVRLEDMRSSRLRVIESHLSEMIEREEKVVSRLEDAGMDFYDETALFDVTHNRLRDVHSRVSEILEDRGDLNP